MKTITELINEASPSKGDWCLWDYKENHVHEILIWKGNGRDISDVTEIDENGTELMNVPLHVVIEYCENHKKDAVDKCHLDISNAKNLKCIKDIF